jgi:uncharacterized membrane protein HdeD (DUF308 family)
MSQNQAPKEKKNIFSNYVVDGILLIIFGVIFLVRPKESLHFFLVVGGIILLIMGGVKLLMTIFGKNKQVNPNPNQYPNQCPNQNGQYPNQYPNQNGQNPNQYPNQNGPNAAGSSKAGSIILAVIQIVIGILLLVKTDFFVELVPFLAGAVIAVGAVLSLFAAIKQKKSGKAPLATPTIILSIIALVLAIIVIFRPGAVSDFLMQLIGIAMLVDGVTVLLSMSK